MKSFDCNAEQHRRCSTWTASGLACLCQCHEKQRLNGAWPRGTWYQKRLALVRLQALERVTHKS